MRNPGARLYLSVLLLITNCLAAFAEKPDSLFFLIPQPKQFEVRSGTYQFSKPYTLNFGNTPVFTSDLLKNAIESKFSLKPSTGEAVNRINLLKADSTVFKQIIQAKMFSPPFDLGSEGYIISVLPGSILILAQENSGIFYGVQTFIQLINANTKGDSLPCLVIYDKPDMQVRGWQDDISRGPIPTLSFLKEQIKRMSSFKLNTFTLYTEHVFKLKKHPSIAPEEGITTEEIKELVSFAKDYYVDVIGNFQSFGHFRNILKTPGYESLGEDELTLSPAKEEAYKFLSEVYSEIVPAYESKYFHINCDEVTLGTGASRSMIDSIGVAGVYAYHISRIDSLLKPYNKKIMMWGDIAVKNPEIINRLPKDMVIVSWGYAPMESMDEEIIPFVKSGFEFIVAPGVSCWSRIYPDLNRSVVNIYNYLRDGSKNKALGFINTTWDDSGQNFFNNNWYGLIWGAECGWNAPKDEPVTKSEETRKNRLAAFNRCYNWIYFNTGKDITSLLFAVSDLRNGAVKNCLSDGSIWSALLPDYSFVPESYAHNNHNLIKTIDSLISNANRMKPGFKNRNIELEYLIFALRQARLVANKNLLGIKLKNYIHGNKTKDISIFEKDFAALADTIQKLKPVYRKLWLQENRNWWLDTVSTYYNSFSGNLSSLKNVCIIQASDTLVKGKREIRLHSAFNNLPVYYTTDGSIPTSSSLKHTQPLNVDTNIRITARVIDHGKMYAVQADSLIFHKAIGKLYKLNSTWNGDSHAYAARGKYGLLDGRRGSRNNFNDGAWQAYLGSDIALELDFGEPIPVSKITMGFAQLMRYGILYPKQIEISVSPDGINYTLIKTEANTLNLNMEARSTHDYVIPLDGANSRYFKIIARTQGALPEWHYAKGKPSWLFADEIMVE